MKDMYRPLNLKKFKQLFKDRNCSFSSLSKELKVNKITVSRWHKGEIRKIKDENFHRLSRFFNIPIEDLIDEENQSSLGHEYNQTSAAMDLINKDLFELCTRTNDWDLFESIVKGVAHNNLSLNDKLMFYFLLSKGNLLKRDFDKSDSYRELGMKLAQKNDNERFISLFYIVQGIKHLLVAEYQETYQSYLKAKTYENLLETKEKNMLLGNIAIVLYSLEDFSQSIILLEKLLKNKDDLPHLSDELNLLYILGLCLKKQSLIIKSHKVFQTLQKKAIELGNSKMLFISTFHLCHNYFYNKDNELFNEETSFLKRISLDNEYEEKFHEIVFIQKQILSGENATQLQEDLIKKYSDKSLSEYFK